MVEKWIVSELVYIHYGGLDRSLGFLQSMGSAWGHKIT